MLCLFALLPSFFTLEHVQIEWLLRKLEGKKTFTHRYREGIECENSKDLLCFACWQKRNEEEMRNRTSERVLKETSCRSNKNIALLFNKNQHISCSVCSFMSSTFQTHSPSKYTSNFIYFVCETLSLCNTQASCPHQYSLSIFLLQRIKHLYVLSFQRRQKNQQQSENDKEYKASTGKLGTQAINACIEIV